jgi:hypothetical protein
VAKASSTTVVANTDEAEHDCGWEELWRAWSCIVERVTAGDWPLSDDGSYGKLYERLTDALQCQVTKDSANVHPAVKRALNLAEPWVSLSALTGLDRKSLRSLSDSCQSLNCALAPAPKKVGRHRLAMCLLFCLLAGLPAACWLLSSSLSRFFSASAFLSLGDFAQSHPLLALLAVGPVIAIGSTALLARMLR